MVAFDNTPGDVCKVRVRSELATNDIVEQCLLYTKFWLKAKGREKVPRRGHVKRKVVSCNQVVYLQVCCDHKSTCNAQCL